MAGTGHSLAFRVMRLCRPALQVDLGLKFDPMDVIQGEDMHDGEELQASIEAREKEGPYWRRSELEKPIDALGLSGLLVLPQTFGSIYLGESFYSYISVGNHSNHDVRDVGIKKVAAASGDMRKALHVCRSALDILETEVRVELKKDEVGTLPSNGSEPSCLPQRSNSIKLVFSENQVVNVARFHPCEENLFITGGSKGSLKLWDVRVGSSSVYKYSKSLGQVMDVDFSPDGSRFATTSHIAKRNSSDKSLVVWSFTTQVPLSNQASIFLRCYC